MTYTFNTYDEYQNMWIAVHSGILYWKKVRQDVQGKICLQVDGSPTHYDEEDATLNLKLACRALKTIEDSTHPEWNEALGQDVIVDGVSSYSSIIYQNLKDEIANW